MSPEDSACEQSFQDSGRYAVDLPFKLSVSGFPSSFSVANQTFLRMQKKFRFNSKLRECYDAFVHEYIKLAHITEIVTEDSIL